MERIFVTYRPVQYTAKLAYHMTLNYLDKEGRHHIIDGGPEIYPTSQEVARELFRSKPKENTSSQFGRLIKTKQDTESFKDHKNDIYRNGQIQKAFTHIAEGQDLSAVWKKFSSTANDLSEKFEYRPTQQNSNTFIGSVLRQNGYNKKLGVKDGGLSKDSFIDDVGLINHDPDRNIRLNIPGANTKPHHPFPVKNKKIQLIPNKLKSPAQPLSNKGAERVEIEPEYNPFDVSGNGFEDLSGEVHLFKTDRARLKKSLIDAGRQGDFASVFEV